MLPRSLAGAPYDEQVTVAEVMTDRRVAMARPKQPRPRRAERHDGNHGVFCTTLPHELPGPGNTVAAVPVQTQFGATQWLTEIGFVIRVERVPGLGEYGVRQRPSLAVETQEPPNIHDGLVQSASLSLPRDSVQQSLKQTVDPAKPGRPYIHPRRIADDHPVYRPV